MHRPTLIAPLDQTRTAAFLVAAGGVEVKTPEQTAARLHGLLGDAVVDHIDHPAHRAAAVQQSARPAQHLNALHAQGVLGHRMIWAQAREVMRCPTVVEQANAVAIQAADDGSARIRAKVTVGHPRGLRQRFTQGNARAQQQLGATQAGHGGRAGVTTQGVASDHHLFQTLGRIGGGCLGHGPRGADGQQACAQWPGRSNKDIHDFFPIEIAMTKQPSPCGGVFKGSESRKKQRWCAGLVGQKPLVLHRHHGPNQVQNTWGQAPQVLRCGDQAIAVRELIKQPTFGVAVVRQPFWCLQNSV